MILLDTNIMVDVLRRYPPALTWLDAIGSETLGIPGLVAMELLQGCRDRQEQQRVEKALHPYTLYWPDRADCARAFDDYVAHRLAYNIGILDALIAETAVGLDVKLATFNERHYQVVRALQTLRPYVRPSGPTPSADWSRGEAMDWQAVRELASEHPELITISGKPFQIVSMTEASLTVEVGSGRRYSLSRANLEKAVQVIGEGETLAGPSDYRHRVADDRPAYAWAILRELGYLQ